MKDSENTFQNRFGLVEVYRNQKNDTYQEQFSKMEIEDETDATKNSQEQNLEITSNLAISNSNSPGFSSQSKNPQKRKYVKKTMAQFLQKSSQSQSQINQERSLDVIAVPLYETPKEYIDFILIGGDFIYKINASEIINQNYSSVLLPHSVEKDGESRSSQGSEYSYRNQADDQLVLYKDVVNITQQDKFISVEMCNKMDGLIDFRSLIGPINNQMSERTGEDHIEMLLQFQETINKSYSAIVKILELYPDRDKLVALQQRRFEYIHKYGVASIRSKFTGDEFLGAGLSMINFEKKMPILQSVAFNQSFVSLIGTDFSQLQSFFLRKGIKEFFDFQTRVNLQTHHIRGLVNKSNQMFRQPFTLLTYDDIKIQCFAEIETIFLEMPDELKYCKDENPFDIVEGGFLLHIILEDSQLQEIIQIRQQMALEKQQHEQMNTTYDGFKKEDDICYNMQSQYFMEKFYQDQLKGILKDSVNSSSASISESMSQEISQEQDPFIQERCKYKII